MIQQVVSLLVGAIVGGYLTHLFQKKNWLYQRKIETFARLIEVVYQQREKVASYAFSKGIALKDKHDRISRDFLPVNTQYYLTSFMLSDEGRAEVRDILAGFENRLLDTEKHFAAESNERLGFESEVRRLHQFLELEISASWFKRAIWYSELRKQRKQFKTWYQTEFPKVLENITSDLRAQLGSDKPKTKHLGQKSS